MAATDLQFSKNSANRSEASFISEGATVIQMERAKEGSIHVYANLDGMEKKYIGGYGNYENGDYKNMVFMVDVLPGATVTIESSSEVVSAKILSGGGQLKTLLANYTQGLMEGMQPGEEAWCHNAKSGGFLKYVGLEKTGFMGVSNGEDNDVWAQMFCGDSNTRSGNKLLAKTTGIYYVKGEETETTADDEIIIRKELKSYVPTVMDGINGARALIFNESDGGGAKFEGVVYDSFVGVNDGSDGIYALMYVKDKNNENNGPRILLSRDKAYFKVGTDNSVGSDNEIVTKGDLNKLAEKIKELEDELIKLKPAKQ